ncbi:unnamed protein product [Pedinophyceae sp. YPF-701]|nr:unnamed protein product [Pedinophyceae sp. YPF-701]
MKAKQVAIAFLGLRAAGAFLGLLRRGDDEDSESEWDEEASDWEDEFEDSQDEGAESTSRRQSARRSIGPINLGVVCAPGNFPGFSGVSLSMMAGKPLVHHVWRNATLCDHLDMVVVVSDSAAVLEAAATFGGTAFAVRRPPGVRGSPTMFTMMHRAMKEVQESGTRVARVIGLPVTAPLFGPQDMSALLRSLRLHTAPVSILACAVEKGWRGASWVEVDLDGDGSATGFRRVAAEGDAGPGRRRKNKGLRSLSAVATSASFVHLLANLPGNASATWQEEEELQRVVDSGYGVRVTVVSHAVAGVTDPSDLLSLEAFFRDSIMASPTLGELGLSQRAEAGAAGAGRPARGGGGAQKPERFTVDGHEAMELQGAAMMGGLKARSPRGTVTVSERSDQGHESPPSPSLAGSGGRLTRGRPRVYSREETAQAGASQAGAGSIVENPALVQRLLQAARERQSSSAHPDGARGASDAARPAPRREGGQIETVAAVERSARRVMRTSDEITPVTPSGVDALHPPGPSNG